MGRKHYNLTFKKIEELSIKRLKQECEKRGLSVLGIKSDLKNRLRELRIEELTVNLKKHTPVSGYMNLKTKAEIALHQLVRGGCAEKIQEYDWQHNPAREVELKQELLHAAAENGHNECVKLLVSMKADIHQRNSKECDAFQRAIVFGQIETMKLLLEMKADVNHSTSDGNQPIHAAAGHWRLNDKARLKVVNLLISAGADVNAKDDTGFCPAHACPTSLELLKTLYRAGADFKAAGPGLFTALSRMERSPGKDHQKKALLCREWLQNIGIEEADLKRKRADIEEENEENNPPPKRSKTQLYALTA